MNELQITIEEILGDAGIEASTEQIKDISDQIELSLEVINLDQAPPIEIGLKKPTKIDFTIENIGKIETELQVLKDKLAGRKYTKKIDGIHKALRDALKERPEDADSILRAGNTLLQNA